MIPSKQLSVFKQQADWDDLHFYLCCFFPRLMLFFSAVPSPHWTNHLSSSAVLLLSFLQATRYIITCLSYGFIVSLNLMWPTNCYPKVNRWRLNLRQWWQWLKKLNVIITYFITKSSLLIVLFNVCVSYCCTHTQKWNHKSKNLIIYELWTCCCIIKKNHFTEYNI